jgi:hypothetical protein
VTIGAVSVARDRQNKKLAGLEPDAMRRSIPEMTTTLTIVRLLVDKFSVTIGDNSSFCCAGSTKLFLN